jgi:transposase
VPGEIGKEAGMKKIPKPSYTAEFRELAVLRVKAGNSFALVAKELAVNQQSLRNWVKAFEAGKLGGPGTRSVSPEQMEISRLRVENIRLQRQCEILKKAAAYFATDAL